MITEIITFKASASDPDLANPRSQFKATLQQLLTTELSADGAKAAYYAQTHRKNPAPSSGYPAHVSSFRTNLIKGDGRGTVFHVSFGEDPSPALEPKLGSQIGVTEVDFVDFRPTPLPDAPEDGIVEFFCGPCEIGAGTE
ncbi:MAG: hypothetical protein LQ343_005087 [Gyalolechia ehrenbergii]|nr:MAG: hypothetical protein LQ343_005087 [Gyalolechia ehrenbergii]